MEAGGPGDEIPTARPIIAFLCFSTCSGKAALAAPGRPLQVRIRAEQLRNPYWYQEHGQDEEARQFWSQGYWERLLSTVAALIHGFGGKKEHRLEAERLADEAVALYREAVQHIWKNIDHESGGIKARWGRTFTLPELIENEIEERKRLPSIFRWPAE